MTAWCECCGGSASASRCGRAGSFSRYVEVAAARTAAIYACVRSRASNLTSRVPRAADRSTSISSSAERAKSLICRRKRLLRDSLVLRLNVGRCAPLQQLGLLFAERSRRGGVRPGAGRSRQRDHLRHTPHRARPGHRAVHPVHVTLRSVSRSLRSQYVSRTVLGALRDSQCAHFRVVHYSVQENHLHLIVEAEDRVALSSGVRGLVVRVARRVNRLLFRRGRFWADRWHGQTLKSPRQVRNALVYVLKNRSKHARAAKGKVAAAALDPLSSAQWFDGFVAPIPGAFRSATPRANSPPQTWLLRVGWQRHGLITLDETPRPASVRHS